MHGHRPRTPEAERSRRWFMNKALLAGGVAAVATMTGCSSDAAGTATASSSSGAPNDAPSGGPGGTPTQQHIHTIVRTPNGGDYGVDLLKPHLDNDH
ncbi:hypothetical protein ACIPN8_21225 [Streptomyces sp. NPDC086082]|uniref:hypothetical protein n=1 Tax=Streptomyces sp. NPDC086082 TaxID=3365750 RepID=UPI00381EB2D1